TRAQMRAFRMVVLVGLAGCSGEEAQPAFSGQGGTLAIPGCPYSITTRIDADAPRIAGGTVGPDPTPRLVHLGVVGDPRTSIVAQWRTADEITTAGSIRYAEGADLSPAQLTTTVEGIQFGYNPSGADIY